MSSYSVIDQVTIQAYLETHYQVHGEPGFTLRIGQASPQLLAEHQQHGVDCSAFLTACNPHSQVSGDVVNNQRQAELANELAQRALSFVPGIGQHPSNGWPGEDSFLVFGLDLEAAKTLGTRLQQNGFIWSDADAVPQLILLR